MRAAAIVGLGSSLKDLKPFQKNSNAAWSLGLPPGTIDADIILIFGGDGTIHRHLAELVELRRPVLVVPCGSGNDFARALGLCSVKDALAAWRKFSSGAGNVRAIDLGVITALGPQGLKPDVYGAVSGTTEVAPFPGALAGGAHAPYPAPNLQLETPASTYFCCAGGVGLDGEIARRANRLPRWLRGHGGYALSLLPALAKYKPELTRILIAQKDAAESWEIKSSKPSFVAVFANAPNYGGGMKIAPRALLEDGLLDLCTVSDVDKLKLFCLFPTVYFGRHLNIPEVEYLQTARVKIETERPLAVYADGEFVCRTPIEVSVAPRVLRVVSA